MPLHQGRHRSKSKSEPTKIIVVGGLSVAAVLVGGIYLFTGDGADSISPGVREQIDNLPVTTENLPNGEQIVDNCEYTVKKIPPQLQEQYNAQYLPKGAEFVHGCEYSSPYALDLTIDIPVSMEDVPVFQRTFVPIQNDTYRAPAVWDDYEAGYYYEPDRTYWYPTDDESAPYRLLDMLVEEDRDLQRSGDSSIIVLHEIFGPASQPIAEEDEGYRR